MNDDFFSPKKHPAFSSSSSFPKIDQLPSSAGKNSGNHRSLVEKRLLTTLILPPPPPPPLSPSALFAAGWIGSGLDGRWQAEGGIFGTMGKRRRRRRRIIGRQRLFACTTSCFSTATTSVARFLHGWILQADYRKMAKQNHSLLHFHWQVSCQSVDRLGSK